MAVKNDLRVLARPFSVDERGTGFLVGEVLHAIKSPLEEEHQSRLEETLPDDRRNLLEAA
jgi:hypothetical protein